MCGFAGFIDPKLKRSDARLKTLVQEMNGMIAARGPDAADEWTDAYLGIAMGHRRLAIMDLSPAGQQPMHSACGRFVLVFNGEIYNHHQIRQELVAAQAAPTWRGHSDTEVMLASIAHWGVEGALQKFNGMFAFALWDKTQRTLTLARDRLGEKPLTYGWVNGVFFFASTLAACRVHPDFTAEINPETQALFLRHGNVPAPYTIYKGMHKLMPGQMIKLSEAVIQAKYLPEATYYWNPQQVIETALHNPFISSEKDAIDQLELLLLDAVKLRMEADVPLGAFLSGGFDSSLITALMQRQSSQQVRSFSIGFHEAAFNESEYARAVAQHLGTQHTELMVSAKDALDVIPLLPQIYDEPFADASALPTYLVSKLTRQSVTVALSGDGGDELFAGYGHYATGERVWNAVGGNHASLLNLSAAALHSLPTRLLNLAGKKLLHKPNLGDQVDKMADLLPYLTNQTNAYRGLVSHWRNMSALMPEVTEPPSLLTGMEALPSRLHDMIPTMQYLDLRTYLSDDILTKVDRASMAVSLEGRIPLLDHRVVAFAFSLPQHLKHREGIPKWILKQLTYRYIPQAIMDRPKQGFAVPLAQWLRSDLRDWAESLLTTDKLTAAGLNAKLVRQTWQAHLSGHRDFKTPIWTVLMLMSFMEHNA